MNYLRTLILSFLLFFLFNPLYAQNGALKVAFKEAASAPRNLNVCGQAVDLTVAVTPDGQTAAARKNLTATLHLFKGVEFVQLNTASSSAGVVLIDGSDVTAPVFRLPDIDPNGASAAYISFSIKANCSYTDTLSKNNYIVVRDRWDFKYDVGAQTGVKESDYGTEYRDALKVPFFTISVSNNVPGTAIFGKCYQRKIVINNSGLNGSVDRFLYTNSQGPGITVQSVTVNGKPIVVTKTPSYNANFDTLITATISGDLLKGNTQGPVNPANGDTIFDPDETVTIIENICVANCTKSRASSHIMSWGCENRSCNMVSAQDLVRLGVGAVNVGFKPSGSLPDLTGGYCKTGRKTITFTNNGVEIDPGTANMYGLRLGIGVGNDSLRLADAGYQITSITIAGAPITGFSGAVIDLRNNPLFKSDPDGAAGGLTDLNGDGYFDDLPMGASVEIVIEYSIDCGISLSNRNDRCFNDFQTGFSAQLDYTDVCNVRNSFIKPSFFAPLNVNNLVENCSDPDASTNGAPFTIQHMERRDVFNFEENCGGKQQFIVKVKMQPGITPVIDSMKFLRFTQSFPLLTHQMNNDTLVLAFDASGAGFLNGDYNVFLGLKADCGASIGPSGFPMQVEYFCPPCDCRHVWYCDTVKGPRIHYLEPPCVPNLAYECAKGLKTTHFQADRTTFGFTDATYKNRFAPDQANRKVAIPCDSVRMTISNVVGGTPISDSIGMVISYQNVDNAHPATFGSPIFKYGSGVATVVHGGITYTCAVDSSRLKSIQQDSTKILTFDLSSCLKGLGITLVAGDSVNFSGNFLVNADGPFLTTFEKIPVFRSYGFYTNNGIQYACDNYGETFRVGKPTAIFSFPNSANFPQGCQTTNLDYRLLNVNNNFYDYFGSEFRQSVAVDSIVFDYDPKFAKSFTLQLQASIPDHPFYGDVFFPVGNFDSTGHYAARFDTLLQVPSLNRVQSYSFDFRIVAVPNCKALTGSSAGDNHFTFTPKLFYKDRYWASVIGSGDCVLSRKDSVKNDIYYAEPPKLTLTPVTNQSVTPVNNVAEWEAKLCNTSQKGNAGITYIAFEPDSALRKIIQIQSILEISDPAHPVTLSLQKYGADSSFIFAYMKGLTVATADHTLSDFCNIVKIKAVVNSCAPAHANIKTGWDCVKSSDPLWSPENYPPCVDLTLPLTINTAFSANLDANYINQSVSPPGICDTTTLEILVRNTDLGKAFDLKTRITIPLQGATLLPGSVQVAYPSHAAYHAVTGAPVAIGTNQKGVIYEYADFSTLDTFLNRNGLGGFNPQAPNDSNEFKIKYKFVNDCEFKSGVLSYYSFIGQDACKNPTNYKAGESLPITIAGAVLDSPKLYDVALDTGFMVPDGESFIQINFKNLTATLSDARDKIAVKLPKGVLYWPGSSVSLQPANWIPGDPSVKIISGIQILEWKQPLNLRLNDVAVLRFTVVSPDSFACDGSGKDISVSTLADKNLLCASFNTSCQSEIITTSNGEHFYTIPSTRGAIVITVSAANFQNGKVSVHSGQTIRISAAGAKQYQWLDASNNSVVSSDSAFSFTPVKRTTVINVTGGDNAVCIRSTSIEIDLTQDTTHPQIFVKDTIVNCKDSFPVLTPTVIDASDSSPTLTFTDIRAVLSCGDQLTRTWTATNRYGNSASAVQTIQRIDKTAPLITIHAPILAGFHSGDTLTVSCDHLPHFGPADATAEDNCDPSVQPDFIDFARHTGNCATDGYQVLLECHWTAVDRCGNKSVWVIFVKVVDHVPPALHNIPKDSVARMGSVVYSAYAVDSIALHLPNVNVWASDNCDDVPTVRIKVAKQDSVLFRTWTASDACGNTSTALQKISLVGFYKPAPDPIDTGNQTGPVVVPKDSIPPVIIPFAPAIVGRQSGDTLTRECSQSFNLSLNDVKVTDNKDHFPSIKLDSASVKGICAVDGFLSVQTYTWTARDSSGNQSVFILYLKYIDSQPPAILNAPADTIISSGSVPAVPSIVTALDACDPQPSLMFMEHKDAVGADTVITRIWTATDACGNVNTQTQKITLKAAPACPVYFDHSPVQLMQQDCSAPASFCTALTVDQASAFHIFEQGAAYTGGIGTCNNGNAELHFTTGYHALVFKKDSSACVDTLNVYVVCNRLDTFLRPDTIRVGDSAIYCLSGLLLPGAINHIENICTSSSNRHAGYDLNVQTNCIALHGLLPGVDTACFIVCTDSGKCVRLQFITTVVRVGRLDTIHIDMTINKTDTICLSSVGLNGSVGNWKNICLDTSNHTVEYKILNDSCIAITALIPGMAKLCFVRCDVSGTCDTSVFALQVKTTAPVMIAPKATPDTAQTHENTPIAIDVLQNDSLNGSLTQMRIFIQPLHGFAETKSQGNKVLILYTPDKNYCSSTYGDLFMYEICNSVGCDRTVATVRVLCNGLKIYTGFSPDGDGINDFFIIDGLNNYSSNKLFIYNRWGNQVFVAENYQNNWKGDWNGTPLPDGVYFYQLQLPNGENYTGYVQLRR